MICKKCKASFVTPSEVNHCRCGAKLDKSGNEIDLKKWHSKASEGRRKAASALHDNVGNCLAKLIPEWAVGSKKGCKCKDIQEQLNRWGTDGCEERFDWIVQKMKGQKRHLRGALSKLPDTVAECGVRYLVKKAIKMSREK